MFELCSLRVLGRVWESGKQVWNSPGRGDAREGNWRAHGLNNTIFEKEHEILALSVT